MNASHRYALVTGASSGIGWHIAKELAQKGYSIIAVSNQPDALNVLKQEVEKNYSISVFTIEMDLARAEAAKEVFDQCELHNLDVEVLVNNAGMLLVTETVEVTYEKVAAILQLHMTTPAILSYLFGKKMMEWKKGYILNVSSISAVMPYPTISLYGPTKTFIRSFTRALRTEMKGDGINVTCLIPGATATALYDAHHVNIPLAMKLGVMKKPEVVARAGVKALFAGRAECIPGILNKLIILLVPVVPHAVIGWIYRLRKLNQ
jgi:uncharacterized protein